MFSFKINKKASSTSVPVQISTAPSSSSSNKAFHDDDDKDEEPDFIDGLEGTSIVSKKKTSKPKKEVLVIPLISKNEWRIDKKADDEQDKGSADNDNKDGKTEETVTVDKPPATLEEQAVKELLEGSSKTSSDKKNNKSIPILFQNKVPDGYEEDDNMDVSLRPEQSKLEDYERIPIEEFGLAMLRGMGWKETEGIGLKNKKVVDMPEPKLRPKGMGLGAEAMHKNKDVAPKNANANNEEKEDLSFKIGGFALITKGSKKGYYGQIESFDEDNNRVILKLGISGKMEAISKFNIDIVSAKEYKKKSKVINSEKYEEYKIIQEDKDRQRREGKNGDREYVDQEPKRRKHKTDSSSDDDEEYRSKKKSKKAEKEVEDYEEKSGRRSRHDRHGESDRSSHRSSERGRRDDRDRDRYTSSRYDDDDKRNDDRGDDDYHKSSSKNGDKKSNRDRHHHRSKKHDDRDRKRRD